MRQIPARGPAGAPRRRRSPWRRARATDPAGRPARDHRARGRDAEPADPGAARRPHLGAARRLGAGRRAARSSRSRAPSPTGSPRTSRCARASSSRWSRSTEEGLTFPIYVVGQVGEPGLRRGRAGHHAPAGDRARRRARPLRRHQAHPAAPHRPLDRPGAALSLQLQGRRARRRHPVDDHAARRRRDRRSRTPPLRVRRRCDAPPSPP